MFYFLFVILFGVVYLLVSYFKLGKDERYLESYINCVEVSRCSILLYNRCGLKSSYFVNIKRYEYIVEK